MKRYLSIVISALLGVVALQAQIVSTDNREKFSVDSVRRALDENPSFGLYKDNYFIFGPALNHKPDDKNTNVKFQISISQRITKSVLPFNSYLYLFYTQRVFWNILENSMPMTDLNFNPGLGLAKYLIVKERYIGKVIFQAEHESNGKNGAASRSWNRISLGANIIVDQNLSVHGKVWIPIIDGGNNKDILDYCGIYQLGTSVMSTNRLWNWSVVLTKRKGWNLNYNAVIEMAYRVGRKQNQFIYAQFYNGYGEGLLDYNIYHSQLRVGFVIKPDLFSDY